MKKSTSILNNLSRKKWLKIIISLKKKANSREIARTWSRNFELQFGVKLMYFARYVDNTGNKIEISALTDANVGEIVTLFNHCSDVRGCRVEERGSGSTAHSYAYRMVQNMTPLALDSQDNLARLADVIHWVCNMYGFDYGREMRFYNFAAFNISNGLIAKGTDQAVASASTDGHRSVRPKSARAASRKEREKSPTPSGG